MNTSSPHPTPLPTTTSPPIPLPSAAREPRRLTAFILDATDSATLLAEKVFSSHTEGYPLDVEVCYPSGQQAVPRLAVSFEDPVSASAEGSVHIFQPLTPLDSELKLIKIVTGEVLYWVGV